MTTLYGLQSQGINEKFARQTGRLIYPNAVNWDELTLYGPLPLNVSLALMLVDHLIRCTVLNERDALSVVTYFADSVTRYTKDVEESLNTKDKEKLKNIMVVMELLGGKLVSMTGEDVLFDIDTQKAINHEEFLRDADPNDIKLSWAWSHTVVLPTFIKFIINQKEYRDSNLD